MKSLASFLFIVLTGLCFMVSSCRKRSHEPNLHDRIMEAHTSQYCRPPDACSNPHVLAVESGYYVTTFLGSKPQHVQITSKEALVRYLQAIPMQAWPRGAIIDVSPTDVMTDQSAVEQNLQTAQQVCRSAGLEVRVLPGG
jgi:hypothetical protein